MNLDGSVTAMRVLFRDNEVRRTSYEAHVDEYHREIGAGGGV